MTGSLFGEDGALGGDDTRGTGDRAGVDFVPTYAGAPLAARHGDKGAVAVLSPAMATAGAALLLRRWWSVPVALLCAGRGAQVLRRTLAEHGHQAARVDLAVHGTCAGCREDEAGAMNS